MKRIIVLGGLLFVFTASLAQNYQTHTLFIYSFTRFIQFPDEDKTGDFEITVLGDSPIFADLKTMSERKKVGDRTIHISKVSSISKLTKCHILFIPVDQSVHLADALAKTEGTSTLVVTEQTGMGNKGSCINFVIKEGKLAFELNQAAIAKHKLKAAAELVRLAILI